MGMVYPKLTQRVAKQACTFIQSGKTIVSWQPTCDTERISCSLLRLRGSIDIPRPSLDLTQAVPTYTYAQTHVHMCTRPHVAGACVARISAVNNVYSGLVKAWKSWEAIFWYCLWRLHQSEVFLFFSFFFTHFSRCAKSNGWKGWKPRLGQVMKTLLRI